MLYKQLFKQLQKLSQGQLYGFIFGLFVSSILFLFIVEYRKFCAFSTELLELKEEYRVYTNTLKKTLEEETLRSGQQLTDKKKKDEELLEPIFMTVNRDTDYLLENALAFAKEQHLKDSVEKLYDVTEWEKMLLPAGRKQAKRQKRRFVAAPARIPKVASNEPKDFIFSWPVDREKFWLSSLFGPRRTKKRGLRFHYGIDMAANKGTPVKAAAAGIVLESYWNNGYGNCIIVAHNRKYKTRYAHLHKRKVRVGQKVTRGEVIGTVGDTGLIVKKGHDGSHLHFEVYAFGRHINPLSVLA